MRRLVLFRHGEAQPRANGGGDLDRPLTARGTADAAAVARTLAARGLQPKVALVSIATRTVETWEQAQPAFPDAEVQFLRPLYDADAGLLWELFEASDADSVLLIGHNPGIHHLAASLARRCDDPEGRKVTQEFPPAACAAFVFDGDKVRLEAALFPNALTGDRA